MSPYGFFGNSNFNSAFLGLTGLFAFPYLFSLKSRHKFLFAFIFVPIFLISIVRTDSQQGLVIMFTGITTALAIKLYFKYRNRASLLSISCVLIILSIFFFQGLFGKGLFANLLYQDSVKARNYYWDAGWRMMIENPKFGIGIDRYGDWYWAYRSTQSISSLGADNYSTSAHNIFLDIGSSGGIPLLLTYIFLIGVVGILSIRFLIRQSDYDLSYVTCFSAWVSLQVYSFFSIGHIGVFVWSWILAGVLVSKYFESHLVNIKSSSRHSFEPKKVIIPVIFILLVFPVVKESLMSKESQRINSVAAYLSYLESNNIEPRNISVALQRIQGSSAIGIEYLRKYLKKFPNNYDLWLLMYTNTAAFPEERSQALTNLIRLNPYNKVLVEQKT
jgi:O-antigen ligase